MEYPEGVVFIAGFPRSGTTYFSNLFNSHEEVIYRHEVLGRCWKRFPPGLFDRMKKDGGLSDSDHETAINTILTAHYEADRPPFFRKSHLLIKNPELKRVLWLGVRATQGVLDPVFRAFFRPDARGQTLVIKETRAATNMDSFLAGLKPTHCVFLFRHPCGAIASKLRGIEKGHMTETDAVERVTFFRNNVIALAALAPELEEAALGDLPEHRLLALEWAVQNLDYIKLMESLPSTLLAYEDFLRDPLSNTAALFDRIDLSVTSQVRSFIHSAGNVRNRARDAGSDYYSVFRSSDFDPDSWQRQLPATVIEEIMSVTLPTYERLCGLKYMGASLDRTATA
ncbi:MAG: sulfotransferase [Pseudomonadota bacterium]